MCCNGPLCCVILKVVHYTLESGIIMKDKSITALLSLADIAVDLCEKLTQEHCLEDTKRVNESETIRNGIYKLLLKQFILPVEKEDLAYLASELHTFNLHLCRIMHGDLPFRFEYADKNTIRSIYSTSVNTKNIIKEGFDAKSNALFASPPHISQFCVKNTFNPSAMLWEYATFTALNEAYKKAESIFNLAVGTAIKNS